jgi:2'-5' RNA ligase
VRLFLAINLPVAERRAIRAATASMRAAGEGRDVQWMGDAQLHITLKFLGERPDDAVSPLRAALAPVVGSHAVFPVELRGLGAFPNLRAPRVVWLGVTPDPKLELLQHDVERTCAEVGYALDARTFRPHITIGRARDLVPAEAARAIAASARGVRYAASVPVHSVDLMASELRPAGARHSVLAALALGGS